MKTYTISLEVLTPVHIGNGNTLSKKDYILKGNYVEVYNPYKLYSILGQQYERFLYSNETLTDFSNRYRTNLDSALEYKLYCGEAGVRKSDNLEEFLKDPYGRPYIPGSSIKGAIRTAILSGLIRRKEGRDDRYADFRRKPVSDRGANIEKRAFGEIIEDKLRHIKISDSLPLSTDDLLLSKKIDVFVDGRPNSINTCRESLKVGTKIEFTLTIDGPDERNWLNPWTPKQIIGSIKNTAIRYRRDYVNRFSITTKDYGSDIIYLGGGTGFATKTINYSLYEENAVDKIADYLANEFSRRRKPGMHNHKKDKEFGVSPHMLKCTKYNNQLVEMGICHIRID